MSCCIDAASTLRVAFLPVTSPAPPRPIDDGRVLGRLTRWIRPLDLWLACHGAPAPKTKLNVWHVVPIVRTHGSSCPLALGR